MQSRLHHGLRWLTRVTLVAVALFALCDYSVAQDVRLAASSTAGSSRSPVGATTVPGAGVPKYVQAVTYFDSAWPINFWNSNLAAAPDDFKNIKADGFNGLVLVVPWGEFQPGLDPLRFDDRMFSRLKQMCQSAKAADLKVFLRVSYLWDFAAADQLPNVARANSIVTNDSLQPVWQAYLKKVGEATGDCASGYFLSWEDYWHVLDMARNAKDPARAAEVSRQIGFDAWVSKSGSQRFRDAHRDEKIRLGVYPVPNAAAHDFSEMYAWFDDQLMHRLLERAAKILPNMSIEARVDSDPIYGPGGETEWYSHDVTYDVHSSPYLMSYWAPAMGAQNNGEVASAKAAIDRFVYMQKKILEKTDNHIFVEQFLYTDNTPKMSHNARIDSKEMGTFLAQMSGPLLQFTSGYALWGYQNYRASVLYNGSFSLGMDGWNVGKGATLTGRPELPLIKLSGKGEGISQSIPASRDHYQSVSADATLRFVAQGEGRLLVAFGGSRQLLNIKEGKSDYHVTLKSATSGSDFTLELLDGSVGVGNIYLYRFVQASSARDDDGRPLPDLEGIRLLNRNLDDMTGVPGGYSVEAGTMDRVVGTYPAEKDGARQFAWAGPKVTAIVRPSKAWVKAVGALNVSMFRGTAACRINGFIDGVDVGSVEFRHDGRFSMALPVPPERVNHVVKVSLRSSCQTQPASGSGDQRELAFILDSLGTP